MSDNTKTYKIDGSDDDLISTDELTLLNGQPSTGVKVQRVKVGFGPDAELRDVDADHPLPVVDSDVVTTLSAVKTLIDALNAKVTTVRSAICPGAWSRETSCEDFPRRVFCLIGRLIEDDITTWRP